MEVYAAMIDCMDQGIGRIVQSLKETDQYENTVIMFLQDNGACAENTGRQARQDYPNRVDKPVYEPYPNDKIVYQREENRRTRDGYPIISGQNVLPGPKDTFIAYGRGWANVSNTPFREYKHWVHEGGISTPLIIHAPSLTAESMKGTFYKEYGQLVDLMTTCVDLAGAEYPKQRKEINVTPMQGTSLKPALQGQTLGRRVPLFWEHEGNRAVREGKWKLVAKGSQSPWELYNIEEDRSELHNLISQHPAIVARLAKQWETWAERSNVLPWPWGEYSSTENLKPGVKFELHFSAAESTDGTKLRDYSEHKTPFKIEGSITRDSEGAKFNGKSWIEVQKPASLNCSQSSWSVAAEFNCEESDAVIVSQGGAIHGYSLYLHNGCPGFAVRIDGEVFSIEDTEKIKGWTELQGVITSDKKLILRVNGKTVTTKEVPDFIQQFPGDPLIIGSDEAKTVLGKKLPMFKGVMKRLVIYRGEIPVR
jgi:arylsulfatase